MKPPRRVAAFCQCANYHHHAVLTLDEWNDSAFGLVELECCLAIHLAPHPSFLARVWNALAYVFTSRARCYQEVMLSESDAEEMRDLLGEFVAMSRGLR